MDYVFFVFLGFLLYYLLIYFIELKYDKGTSASRPMDNTNLQNQKYMQEMTYYARTNLINENIKQIKGQSNGK